MIKETDDQGKESSDLARRVRAIAKDLFTSCNDFRSGASPQLDPDDISPLYNSIAGITHRYQSQELVGEGGMKEVYRAYDAKLTRHVALAKPLARHSKNHFDGFLREAHLTARLEHPGIIEVFNIGIDDQQRPFFTMEFKKGRSARIHSRYTKQQPEPPDSREAGDLYAYLRGDRLCTFASRTAFGYQTQ